MSTDIVRAEVVEIEPAYSLTAMSARLEEMKQRLQLVKRFFRDVMVKGEDYGEVPGTDKPTLLKPGAEKLCEFYGFGIVLRSVEETADHKTGFYRAKVVTQLVSRRTGEVVAEGIGEANTNEGRYRWRWVPEWKLPQGIDKTALYCEERRSKDGKTYKMYRVDNDDPFTLWNTVLKMAKKRSLVDAVLSATRSSGIFTQDVEDWAAEDLESQTSAPQPKAQKHEAKPEQQKEPAESNGDKRKSALCQTIYQLAHRLNIDDEMVKMQAAEMLGRDEPVESLKKLTYEQLDQLRQHYFEAVQKQGAKAKGQP